MRVAGLLYIVDSFQGQLSTHVRQDMIQQATAWGNGIEQDAEIRMQEFELSGDVGLPWGCLLANDNSQEKGIVANEVQAVNQRRLRTDVEEFRFVFFSEGLQRLRFGDLSVSDSLYDFEDFGPGWEWSLVFLFVSVNRHEEVELLIGHFAFFGDSSFFGPSVAGASSSIESDASVDDAFSSFLEGSFFGG
jgi:hypothetical protein